jgi:ABC-type multidrug transport system ATPase subunit
MKQIAIRASALTRQFSSVRALTDLTIEVPAGVVFGFLGPNGAGKTTTIRLLLNLIEPTGGSAEVLGFDTRTHGHEIRSRCGALLEHSGLYERLSAEDTLGFIRKAFSANRNPVSVSRGERIRTSGLLVPNQIEVLIDRTLSVVPRPLRPDASFPWFTEWLPV